LQLLREPKLKSLTFLLKQLCVCSDKVSLLHDCFDLSLELHPLYL
jgi:hypothetical protein